MRMPAGITIVMLSQGLAGCRGPHYLSPTAPSAPSVPSPSPSQPTRLAGVLPAWDRCRDLPGAGLLPSPTTGRYLGAGPGTLRT